MTDLGSVFRLFIPVEAPAAPPDTPADSQTLRENPLSHDQLVKEILRVFFADFLSLVLPGVARRLRLGRQEFLDKELFTDWPRGKRRRGPS